MLIMGEAMHVWGQGAHYYISAPSSWYCSETETTLKQNEVLKKKKAGRNLGLFFKDSILDNLDIDCTP